MEQATIVGEVVATTIVPSLVGVRLLLAQLEDQHGQPVGQPVVVADAVQAGIGDRVQLVLGREASLALDLPDNPVDLAVVAIVDGFDAEGSP